MKMKQILLLVTLLNYSCATYGINGGQKADKSDFKYIVSIVATKDLISTCTSSSKINKLCVGGIIGEKLVLTAAHCFTEIVEDGTGIGNKFTFIKRRMMVYANTDHAFLPTIHSVIKTGEKVYFMTEFFKTGVDDIAILKLDTGLSLKGENSHILKILTFPSVAGPGESSRVGQYKSYENTMCLIAGFGQDNTPQHNDFTLKKMYSLVLFRSLLPKLYYGYPSEKYDENKFLFGQAINRNGDKPTQAMGTCKGDSGAPVVLDESPSTIIGVLTSGPFSCDSRENEDFPGRFMRVTNYRSFIDDVISSQVNKMEYTMKLLS